MVPEISLGFLSCLQSPTTICKTTLSKQCAWGKKGGPKNISSVQSLGPVQLCHPMDCSTPGFPVHHQYPELAQTHVHLVSDAIQPSHPLSSPSLPAFNLSQHQGLFQWVTCLHQVAKVLVLQLQHQSFSNNYSGLISFRMDWLDFQGTLKSLLQHHSSKASIFWCSVFFIVQLSHPYMTTGKTIALTRRTLVGKLESLLFNMLSRLVTVFLPRSKHLLISWLQSPCSDFGAQKKVCHCFYCFPIYLSWSDGLDAGVLATHDYKDREPGK